MRGAALSLGRHLQEKGLLDRAEDVFYLHLQEVRDACLGASGGARESLKAAVRARKERAERWARFRVPALVSEEEVDEPGRSLAAGASGPQVLRGIGVSPGRATGRAFFPETYEPERVPDGSVLVMPGLDPGWTPVLSKIVGLVTEAGGLLSHGAILAREFGVPAVSSAAGALTVIRPGQVVTVDGSRGIVELSRFANADTRRRLPGDPRTPGKPSD